MPTGDAPRVKVSQLGATLHAHFGRLSHTVPAQAGIRWDTAEPRVRVCDFTLAHEKLVKKRRHRVQLAGDLMPKSFPPVGHRNAAGLCIQLRDDGRMLVTAGAVV